jgi:hypothetical protein
MKSHYSQVRQVISSVAKWCWSRLSGGIVGWDAYELFKIGEGGECKLNKSLLFFFY